MHSLIKENSSSNNNNRTKQKRRVRLPLSVWTSSCFAFAVFLRHSNRLLLIYCLICWAPFARYSAPDWNDPGWLRHAETLWALFRTRSTETRFNLITCVGHEMERQIGKPTRRQNLFPIHVRVIGSGPRWKKKLLAKCYCTCQLKKPCNSCVLPFTSSWHYS